MHARLARTAAFDADAAGHFDDAGEQAKRRLKAPAGRILLEFLAPDRVAQRERAFARHDGRRADDVNGLGNRGNREIHRNGCGFADDNRSRDGRRLEAGERRRDPIPALRQRHDAEVSVAFAEHRRHLPVDRVADDDLGTAEADRTALGRHDAVNHAGAGRPSLGHRRRGRQ